MSKLGDCLQVIVGGKSEHHRAGCQLTAGGGDSKDSATEINRLVFLGKDGKVG